MTTHIDPIREKVANELALDRGFMSEQECHRQHEALPYKSAFASLYGVHYLRWREWDFQRRLAEAGRWVISPLWCRFHRGSV